MLSINLYYLAVSAASVALVILLIVAFFILRVITDWSFVIVTGGKKILINYRKDRASKSHQEDLGAIIGEMSHDEARKYLQVMRDDLEAERQEVAHARLPMSFDLDHGNDAYRHQEMSKLRSIEERISFIDELLSNGYI